MVQHKLITLICWTMVMYYRYCVSKISLCFVVCEQHN